jgi:hypothetical protein
MEIIPRAVAFEKRIVSALGPEAPSRLSALDRLEILRVR